MVALVSCGSEADSVVHGFLCGRILCVGAASGLLSPPNEDDVLRAKGLLAELSGGNWKKISPLVENDDEDYLRESKSEGFSRIQEDLRGEGDYDVDSPSDDDDGPESIESDWKIMPVDESILLDDIDFDGETGHYVTSHDGFYRLLFSEKVLYGVFARPPPLIPSPKVVWPGSISFPGLCQGLTRTIGEHTFGFLGFARDGAPVYLWKCFQTNLFFHVHWNGVIGKRVVVLPNGARIPLSQHYVVRSGLTNELVGRSAYPRGLLRALLFRISEISSPVYYQFFQVDDSYGRKFCNAEYIEIERSSLRHCDDSFEEGFF